MSDCYAEITEKYFIYTEYFMIDWYLEREKHRGLIPRFYLTVNFIIIMKSASNEHLDQVNFLCDELHGFDGEKAIFAEKWGKLCFYQLWTTWDAPILLFADLPPLCIAQWHLKMIFYDEHRWSTVIWLTVLIKREKRKWDWRFELWHTFIVRVM